MQQKRIGTNKPKKKSFHKEYNFEIKVILLLALGIFLLIEKLEIKHYLFEIFKYIFFNIGIFLKWSINKTAHFIKQFEFSDIVGISLIFYVLYLITERWRERMIDRFPNITNCSKCGGTIHRIPKNWNHKVMGYVYFVTVKHYQCKECMHQEIKLIN